MYSVICKFCLRKKKEGGKNRLNGKMECVVKKFEIFLFWPYRPDQLHVFYPEQKHGFKNTVFRLPCTENLLSNIMTVKEKENRFLHFQSTESATPLNHVSRFWSDCLHTNQRHTCSHKKTI